MATSGAAPAEGCEGGSCCPPPLAAVTLLEGRPLQFPIQFDLKLNSI